MLTIELFQSKVLVSCLCREQVSNACDLGTPKAPLMQSFPHLDFSLVATDVWWYRDEEATKVVTPDNYKEEWLRHRYEEPHGTFAIPIYSATAEFEIA